MERPPTEHVVIQLSEGERVLKLVSLPGAAAALDRTNGERILLPRTQPLLLGRRRPAPDRDGANVVLRLADDRESAAVGRLHLEIHVEPDGAVSVVDRSSTGTLVDGTRLRNGERVKVRPGSRVGLVALEAGTAAALVEIVVQGDAVGELAPAPENALDNLQTMQPDRPPSRADRPLPPPGSSLSRAHELLREYELVKQIGKGAAGEVYLMRQLNLDRLVAVKVVRPDVFNADEARRLIKEARVLARLNHANIMAIHDVGTRTDTPYMVCEYVEGQTLRVRLASPPPLSLAGLLAIFVQILDGLGAAHREGIVHRDLKPANVLLTKAGRPKIADFGLARSREIPAGASVGFIMGTPMYMSPEQCRGQDTDAASDLYAIGVMLYEAVVGQLPFKGPEALDFVIQHTSEPAPLARTLNPAVPAALEEILARALAKDPAERPASAAELMKPLLALYKSLTSDLPRPGPARPLADDGNPD